MSDRILIAGAGFAGLWSALGAARLVAKAGRPDGSIEVALLAPAPVLNLRPRFHEACLADMSTPLTPLLDAVGVRFIQGQIERIHTRENSVEATGAAGNRFSVAYDRLVLATGSRLYRPELPGLREHAFSIDQIEEVGALDEHIKRLASLPDTPARNTVVVVGGGFTGIEIATALPERLRAVWGDSAAIDVIVIEQAAHIGPDLGPGPRPVIEQALRELGVTCRLGATPSGIDADGLWIATGERIETKTVIWTAGLRASALTQ